MRFERCASVAAIVLMCAAAAAAAEDPAKAKGKANPAVQGSQDVQAAYQRAIELARETQTDPNAGRWVDSLFLDPRARSVNDILTVRVVESVNAAGTADASVAKNNSGSASLTNLFGLESTLSKFLNPTNLVSGTSDTKFKGSGTTSRTGSLTANMSVRVAEVFPNGNLALEGAREIQINGDRQVLILTGIVRPIDIGPGNVVPSTSIGQLRVQYIGNGLMKDSLSPGWLVKILNKVF